MNSNACHLTSTEIPAHTETAPVALPGGDAANDVAPPPQAPARNRRTLDQKSDREIARMVRARLVHDRASLSVALVMNVLQRLRRSEGGATPDDHEDED